MRADEFIVEAKTPSIRQQIIDDVKKHGPGEYFVRFTDVDKLGFSGKQTFGKSLDVDHPKFDIDYIGSGEGKRALWFYPLDFYLKSKDAYASTYPYVWLVKLKPDSWLQVVKSSNNELLNPPEGKERVGILKKGFTPAAIFFKPGFTLIGKYYNYSQQHTRHGEVKGKPERSFFDRVRGLDEGFVSDIPNTEWLQSKINYARKMGRNKLYDTPHFGTITGYFTDDTVPVLPVELLKEIPGAQKEQQNVRPKDLLAIKKILSKTGKLPLMRYSKNESYPLIAVSYNGEPWVLEGNHRIMAAYELGWKELPVEIRYFDGGELIKPMSDPSNKLIGILHPSRIKTTKGEYNK